MAALNIFVCENAENATFNLNRDQMTSLDYIIEL